MDATVAAALASGVSDFVDGAIAQLTANLPVALGVTITVAVVFFGIRTFRAIAHI